MIVRDGNTIEILNDEGKIVYAAENVIQVHRLTQEHLIIINDDEVAFIKYSYDSRNNLTLNINKINKYKSINIKDGLVFILGKQLVPYLDIYNSELELVVRLLLNHKGEWYCGVGILGIKKLLVEHYYQGKLFGKIGNKWCSYCIGEAKLNYLKSIEINKPIKSVISEMTGGKGI